jgi:two-component system, LytTR family, response regulator
MSNLHSNIRSIIVEDEATSRQTLRNYLGTYCSEIELVGEYSEIESAENAIRSLKPDLVFLDVEMPFGTGFDLLKKFDTIDFEVVFVTAYSQYAIQALNVSACYYIMKPIDIDELIEAVGKVKENLDKGNYSNKEVLLHNIHQSNPEEHRISLPTLDGFELVKIKDIVRCKAADNYTELHLTNGKNKLICKTLKYFDEVLKPYGFFRTHKSHLVNLSQVEGYKKGSGGYAVMSNSHEVEIATRKKAAFLKELQRV